jgi:putative membrane protein
VTVTDPHPAAEPRKRLHPLTPLLRSARFIGLAVVAISWQGYQQLGLKMWVVAIVCVMIVAIAVSVVSWLATGYHVVERELRVYEGLLWRRTRAIPLARLQAVELVRSPLARIFGLAELRLEVVGAAKTEAPLAYLPVFEATELRRRLLALAGIAAEGAPVADGAAGADGAVANGVELPAPARAPERLLHRVDNQDLLVSQLLRPQWWFVPLAVIGPIVVFGLDGEMSFIGIASMLTAVVGVIAAPVRTILGDWHFTVATAADGLRLRRGALETRSQTVPGGRVQAVGVQWPLLWRGKGWVRARIDVAGVAAPSGNETSGQGTLLPVATIPVARSLVAEVLPAFDLTSVVVRTVPPQARWVAPLRRRVLGYTLTDAAFVTQDGLITRQLVIVPFARIQSVRLRQGPLQRRLGLANVYADTAGGSLTAVAEHRDLAEAHRLADQLSTLARAARRSRPSGAESVVAAVDVDDLAGGGREPV